MSEVESVIDTYEAAPVPVVEEDALAEFREQSKTENRVKVKMTDRAAAALRAIGEHDRANKIADARLTEWSNAQTKTVESLMDTLYAISPGYTKDIRKRAFKAYYMLSRGLKVYAIHDVSFLGSLLPEEETMTLAKILTRYPIDEEKAIEPVQLEAEVRLCALGSKCLRSYKRKAAVVLGTGMYCSANCKGAAQAAKRRAKVTVLRKNSIRPFTPVSSFRPDSRTALLKIVVAQEAPVIVGFQPVVEVNVVQIGCDHFLAEFMSFRT